MENYKNSKNAKIIESKYGDILNAARPMQPENHPRMSLTNRAKIFSPFSALRGYDEEIKNENTEHLKVRRLCLSDEEIEKIEAALSRLIKGQPVNITYFTGGEDEYGFYQNISGTVISVDEIINSLSLKTNSKSLSGKILPTVIQFKDILRIDTGENTSDY